MCVRVRAVCVCVCVCVLCDRVSAIIIMQFVLVCVIDLFWPFPLFRYTCVCLSTCVHEILIELTKISNFIQKYVFLHIKLIEKHL